MRLLIEVILINFGLSQTYTLCNNTLQCPSGTGCVSTVCAFKNSNSSYISQFEDGPYIFTLVNESNSFGSSDGVCLHQAHPAVCAEAAGVCSASYCDVFSGCVFTPIHGCIACSENFECDDHSICTHDFCSTNSPFVLGVCDHVIIDPN